MDIKQLCEKNKMVKMYAGSLAYGTNLPTSDVDFRGLFCADPINILTPFFPVSEYNDVTEEDSKYYELWHFSKLCMDCNPNIVELLWTDDEQIVFRTPAYDKLREGRSLFLSSKIAFTTTGYAMAQMKRIKGHNKWINNPQPEQPPKQYDYVSLVHWFGGDKMFARDFNLSMFDTNYTLIHYGNNIYGLIDLDGSNTINGDTSLKVHKDRETLNGIAPLAILKYNIEQYKTDKEKHKQYWDWKNNRNEKRSELEEKFGYDTKHAMHLVRLMRMGLEALSQEQIIVQRPDAKELLEIRNGALTYDELIEYGEHMDDQIRNIWYKKTKLPKYANVNKVAQLIMDVQNIAWETNE